MFAWIILGFVPTLGIGNVVMNRIGKRKLETSPDKLFKETEL